MAKRIQAIATVMTFGMLSSAAQAGLVTIDYDFTKTVSNPPFFETSPSLTLTAISVTPSEITADQAPQITATASVPDTTISTGFTTTVITTTNDYVAQGSAGLGVYWTGSQTTSTPLGRLTTPLIDTSPEIDGFGPDDTLNFAFSNFNFVSHVAVTLAGVTLIQANDDVRILLNGSLAGTYDPTNGPEPQNISLNIALKAGDVLSFAVAGENDDFGVASLRLVATVPEPGTLALLGAGLAGIGYKRRKKAA